jgi:beta-mannosidase
MRFSWKLVRWLRVVSAYGTLAVVALAAVGAARASEETSRTISSGWQLRAVGDIAAGHDDVKAWHPATVPGVVQTDLLANKLIADPFYQDNEKRLQWISYADWEYQTSFDVDAATMAHERVELVFEGLDTFADVYLNDTKILTADNMFRRWRVDVKSQVKVGANTLRVVLHSPITKMLPYVKALPFLLVSPNDASAPGEPAVSPYVRKAPYQFGWDWGPRFVTLGIWQPIHLDTWDAARVDNFHIEQQKIGADNASLNATVAIVASKPVTVTVAFSHHELPSGATVSDGAQTLVLDAGENEVSYAFRVAKPKLWWPLGYGAQNRYAFSAVITSGAGKAKETLAHADVRTGLRTVELRRETDQWGKSFAFYVNGVAVFAKGADVIPFDSFPNRVTPASHRQILQSAADAHMNMVREWGGGYYESDDFYDICDELGIMVWQEFAFGGAMVPGDLPWQQNVQQEAVEQIKRLRAHPSIVLWCGNNEVETGWFHWGDREELRNSISPMQSFRVWQDYIILFADILKSAVNQNAGVPYWPSSPSSNFEEPPDNQHNGDMHYWAVWHQQAPAMDYTKQFPRFMSEFGFQSFPEMRTIRSFAEPADFDIHSATMVSHQKNFGGNDRILTYMLREYREPKNFESYVYLSQVQQAEIIKIGAEHLRRQRPRVMGSLYWQLNDCWPVASWASIDYYGRWKALQYYAKKFYADTIVSPFAHDGKIDVYVVADSLTPQTGTIRTRLMDFSGKVLSEKTSDVQIAAQSSAVAFTLDQKDFLAAAGNANPAKTFLVFDLSVGGKAVSRNTIFFGAMHDLDLPVAPKVDASIATTADGYAVTLMSPVLARSAFVTFGDRDATFSDNYMDVLPGEPVTINVKSAATLEDLKGAMKVTTLTEAY